MGELAKNQSAHVLDISQIQCTVSGTITNTAWSVSRPCKDNYPRWLQQRVFQAAEVGDIKTMTFLLERGANVFATTRHCTRNRASK
jgi:hypothetical protein